VGTAGLTLVRPGDEEEVIWKLPNRQRQIWINPKKCAQVRKRHTNLSQARFGYRMTRMLWVRGNCRLKVWIYPNITGGMSLKQTLLDDIEAFLASTGMKHTAFGSRALNDPAFVTRLREGKDIQTKTIERVRAFMEDHRRPLARRRAAGPIRQSA
jgi:hypothetical protein